MKLMIISFESVKMETINKDTFTEEDLTTKDAIWAVIYDKDWKILIQDHVKLNFYTIPIGKIKSWEDIEAVMRAEVFEENGITVTGCNKLIEQEWTYDYNWLKARIRNHIFEITSWEWELQNKEPQKHRWSRFVSLEELRKMTPISDATRIYLSLLKDK